jgi:transcription initiation factor TFIID subunit 2
LVLLAKGKVIQPKLIEFLQYTRAENSDQVRLKAFDCLIELDMLRNDSVMKYFLHELSTDPSPHIRENMYRLLWKGLGKIAIGDEASAKEEPTSNGLIIEQETDTLTKAKQTEAARKQTVPGALRALRAEIGENTILQEALWSAVK